MRQLIIMAMMLVLSACSLAPIKTAPVNTYTIASFQKHHSVSRKGHGVLLVDAYTPAPGYQTSAMLYVNVPFEIQHYANHRWVAPPDHLLLMEISEGIRNSGLFADVVTPPFIGITDYHLVLRLLMLQQEYLQPVSQVHLKMSVNLINSRTNKVMASQVFEQFVPAIDNTPYSGVLATNVAAQNIMKRIITFLRHNL